MSTKKLTTPHGRGTKRGGRQSPLRRREQRARDVLAHPSVQEFVAAARAALGIPAAGFGSDLAGQRAWHERVSTSLTETLTTDTAEFNAIYSVLSAAGVEIPAHWQIHYIRPHLDDEFRAAMQSLKRLAGLDDTWDQWAHDVLFLGETEAPITLPMITQFVPAYLKIGLARDLVGVGDTQATDPHVKHTSRPVIYVADDMDQRDVLRALRAIRDLQQWQAEQGEAPTSALRSGPSGSDLREMIVLIAAMREQKSRAGWAEIVRSDTGQRFLQLKGMQEANDDMKKLVIMKAVSHRQI